MATPQTNTESPLYLDRITLQNILNREYTLRLFIENEERELRTNDNRTWTLAQRPDLSPKSTIRAEIQRRSGHLFWAKNRQTSEVIVLGALFDEYWSSTKHEFTVPKAVAIGKYQCSLELRFSSNTTAAVLRGLLHELEGLLKKNSLLMSGWVERAEWKGIKSGAVFGELNPIAKAVFGVGRVTFELLKAQSKYDQIPSGLLDQLQHLSSLANEVAEENVCETGFLQQIIPRMFVVIHRLAKFSCDYVRHGRLSSSRLGKLEAAIAKRTADGPAHQEAIKEMDRELTKVIKEFTRAVDVEALRLAKETGTSHLFFYAIEEPADRLPVEIWQDILRLAIESDGYSLSETTRTPSTFIHSLKQEKSPDMPYIEYARRRATLRRVCRAWNQLLLSTNCSWSYLRSPTYHWETFDLPSVTDLVPTFKELSMTITTHECVEPGLDWASELLQKAQVTLSSFNLALALPSWSYPNHTPCDILAAVSTRTALRSLRVASRSPNGCVTISFPQLNANFKDLVSLSISNLAVHHTHELVLPRLELLHISMDLGSLPLPTQAWNLPSLRHVSIGAIKSMAAFNPILTFLRRYASQLESLCLMEHFRSHLPQDFWVSFTALQLLGLRFHVLSHLNWGGWDNTPPPGHPFRYLVCRDCVDPQAAVDSLRSMWTYHEDVMLVVESAKSGEYYTDIKQEDWGMKMTEIDGILPMPLPITAATT